MTTRETAEIIHELARASYLPFAGDEDNKAIAKALADISKEQSQDLTDLMRDVFAFGYIMGQKHFETAERAMKIDEGAA